MKARANPTQLQWHESKLWLEADTKEGLYREIISFELRAGWLASRMYKVLTGDERPVEDIHDEQIAHHMGDPKCVPFTIEYEDGTTEPFEINMSAQAVHIELAG